MCEGGRGWTRGRPSPFPSTGGVEEPLVRDPLDEGGLSSGEEELSWARSGEELLKGKGEPAAG